jgi:hypothetical protein
LIVSSRRSTRAGAQAARDRAQRSPARQFGAYIGLVIGWHYLFLLVRTIVASTRRQQLGKIHG